MTRASWIVSAAVLVGVAVVYSFRGVFGPLLAAVALAYVLEPLTAWLARRMPRYAAVCIVFFGFAAVGITVGILLVVQGLQLAGELSRDGGRVVEAFSTLGDWVRAQLEDLPDPVRRALGGAFGDGSSQQLVGRAAEMAGSVLQTVIESVNTLALVVFAPFYLFYLMLDLPRVWRWTVDHIPSADRERTMRVLGQVHSGLAAFLRGRLVLALIRGAVTALGLALIGTPLAFVVGMGSGLLTVVPFLGPVLGWLVAFALTLSDVGLTAALVVTGGFVVIEWIENLILQPIVMKQGVELHPMTVLFCVVFWGAVLGVFGALVAIPLTLVLKILAQEYLMPEIDQLADPRT